MTDQMNPLSHLRWIEEMLDRADPLRRLREQEEAVQKVLDRADPTRMFREQEIRVAEALDNHVLSLTALGRGARELQMQYGQRLVPPSELATAHIERDLTIGRLGLPRFGDIEKIKNNLIQAIWRTSQHLSKPTVEMPIAFSSSLSVLKQYTDYSEFEAWNRSMASAAKDITSAYGSFAEGGFPGLAGVLTDIPDWLERIREASSPVLGMLAHDLVAGLSTGINPSLLEGFGADLVSHISRISELESGELAHESVESLLEWLLHVCREAPNTPLVRNAIMTIFITLMQILISQVSVQRSEERLIEQIEDTGAKIERRLDHLESVAVVPDSNEVVEAPDEKTESDYYIVVTDLRLRCGPGTDFEVMRMLPPNLTVRIEMTKDGWALVEFFDFVEGKLVMGWVSDKYLVALSDTSGL